MELTSFIKILSVAITVGFLTFGCKDDGVSVDQRRTGLFAQVVDANNATIADVGVHYIFYTNVSPDNVMRNPWIQYALATQQVVTLKVFNMFEREVATLVNGLSQPAGQHIIQFNDTTVTNGVFTYRVQTGEPAQSGSFYIRDDDITRLQKTNPLLKSDNSGQFFVSHSALGVGRSFQRLSIVGPPIQETIVDSVSIVLVKNGFRTLVELFRLDTTKAVEKTFRLVRN